MDTKRFTVRGVATLVKSLMTRLNKHELDTAARYPVSVSSDPLLSDRDGIKLHIHLTLTKEFEQQVRLTLWVSQHYVTTVISPTSLCLAIRAKVTPTNLSCKRLARSALVSYIIDSYYDEPEWPIENKVGYLEAGFKKALEKKGETLASFWGETEDDLRMDCDEICDELNALLACASCVRRTPNTCGCGTVSSNALDVCDRCVAVEQHFEDCLICLKPVFECERAKIACCKAIFHQACLNKWKSQKEKRQKCPQCRAVL